jgi:hypothetical protein
MLPYDVRLGIPTRALPAPRPRLLGDRANHPEHGSPDRAYRDGASLAALGKRAEGIGRPSWRARRSAKKLEHVIGGRPVGGLQHLASSRIAHPRGYAATRAAAMAAFGKSWCGMANSGCFAAAGAATAVISLLCSAAKSRQASEWVQANV